MTLGERISARRTLLGWSQADLAERLDVSRQSVSKWETDASVPDLDKLVKLCGVFDMTLDQLVRGEEEAPPEEGPGNGPPLREEKRGFTRRDGVGIGLIFFGCLAFLLLAMQFGDIAAAAVCASVFWILGVICLVARRNAGLWCGWMVWGMLTLYLWRLVGLAPWWIFAAPFYQVKGFAIHLLLAWGEALALAVLLVFTGRAWRLRKKRP